MTDLGNEVKRRIKGRERRYKRKNTQSANEEQNERKAKWNTTGEKRE